MKSIKIVSFICMLVLFSAFSLTVTSVPSNGNTIYVDDDAPPEWYDETHVQTIQEGIDIASDGDTVYVYSGIYLENVNVDKSINLIGEEKDTTIIDGGENDHVVLISKDLVLISEFTMRNSSSGIYLNQFANQVTLSDNLIHNNQYIAIHAPFSDTMNLVISNNKIISNYFGIISYASPISISNNEIIQDNRKACIELIGIENSRITDNLLTSYGTGITIEEGYDTIISGNIIDLIGNRPIKGIEIRMFGDNNTITCNYISGITTAAGQGILLEIRERPSDELQGQIVSFNTISNLYRGVRIQYSPRFPKIWNNKIINNNFFDVLVPSHFQNALGTKWSNNYWGNPRLFPYRISGIISFNDFVINWRQFDINSRLLPNDIPTL